MENNFMLTDDLLWDYADGFLDPAEKQQVERYVQQHPDARRRLDNILAEKQELFSLSLEAPNAGFADRVMAAWAAEHVHEQAKAKGGDWIIRIIPVVFGLFVLTPVVVMVLAALQLAPGELPTVPLPEMPVINWAAWVSNPILQYGLLLTLVLIGLRFLDKYLQHWRLVHAVN